MNKTYIIIVIGLLSWLFSFTSVVADPSTRDLINYAGIPAWYSSDCAGLSTRGDECTDGLPVKSVGAGVCMGENTCVPKSHFHDATRLYHNVVRADSFTHQETKSCSFSPAKDVCPKGSVPTEPGNTGQGSACSNSNDPNSGTYTAQSECIKIELDFNAPEYRQGSFSIDGTGNADNWMLNSIVDSKGNKYEMNLQIDRWITSRFDSLNLVGDDASCVYDPVDCDNVFDANICLELDDIGLCTATVTERLNNEEVIELTRCYTDDDPFCTADPIGWKPDDSESITPAIDVECSGGGTPPFTCSEFGSQDDCEPIMGQPEAGQPDTWNMDVTGQVCEWASDLSDSMDINPYKDSPQSENFGGGIRVFELTKDYRAQEPVTTRYYYTSEHSKNNLVREQYPQISSGSINIVPTFSRMHENETEERPRRHLGSNYVTGGVLYNSVTSKIVDEPGEYVSYFTTVDTDPDAVTASNGDPYIDFYPSDASSGIAVTKSDGTNQYPIRYAPVDPDMGCCQFTPRLRDSSFSENDFFYDARYGFVKAYALLDTENSPLFNFGSTMRLGYPADSCSIFDFREYAGARARLQGLNEINQPHMPGAATLLATYTTDMQYYDDRYYDPLDGTCSVHNRAHSDCVMNQQLGQGSCNCGDYVITISQHTKPIACSTIEGDKFPIYLDADDRGVGAGTDRSYLRGLNYRTQLNHPNFISRTERRITNYEYAGYTFGAGFSYGENSFQVDPQTTQFIVNPNSEVFSSSAGVSIGKTYLTQERHLMFPDIKNSRFLHQEVLTRMEDFDPYFGDFKNTTVKDYYILGAGSTILKQQDEQTLSMQGKYFDIFDDSGYSAKAKSQILGIMPESVQTADGQHGRPFQIVQSSLTEYNTFGPREIALPWKENYYSGGITTITEYDYDNQGRVIKRQKPDGETERFEYDQYGRVTKKWREGIGSSSNPDIEYTYDNQGFRQSSSPTYTQKTELTTDGNDLVQTTTKNSLSSSRSQTTRIISQNRFDQSFIQNCNETNCPPLKTIFQDEDTGSETITFNSGSGRLLQEQIRINNDEYLIKFSHYDIHGKPTRTAKTFTADTNGNYIEEPWNHENFQGWMQHNVYEAGLEGRLIQKMSAHQNILVNPSFEVNYGYDKAYWELFDTGSYQISSSSGIIETENAHSGVRSMYLRVNSGSAGQAGIRTPSISNNILQPGEMHTYNFYINAQSSNSIEVASFARCSLTSGEYTNVGYNPETIDSSLGWVRMSNSFEVPINAESCRFRIALEDPNSEAGNMLIALVDDVTIKLGSNTENDGYNKYSYNISYPSTVTASGFMEVTVKDANNNAKKLHYNAKDQLIMLEEGFEVLSNGKLSEDPLSRILYEYDPMGNLLSIRDIDNNKILEREYGGEYMIKTTHIDTGSTEVLSRDSQSGLPRRTEIATSIYNEIRGPDSRVLRTLIE